MSGFRIYGEITEWNVTNVDKSKQKWDTFVKNISNNICQNNLQMVIIIVLTNSESRTENKRCYRSRLV